MVTLCDSWDVKLIQELCKEIGLCYSQDVKKQELCQVTVCTIHGTLRCRDCVRNCVR